MKRPAHFVPFSRAFVANETSARLTNPKATAIVANETIAET
jgi:hypothetical protein